MYWSIENRNSARDHKKAEGSKISIYISSLIFVWLIGDEGTIYYITMQTNQTVSWSFNDDSKI